MRSIHTEQNQKISIKTNSIKQNLKIGTKSAALNMIVPGTDGIGTDLLLVVLLIISKTAIMRRL
jgi:hypothetical protein